MGDIKAKHAGGRPRKFQDPVAFDKMIDDFFIECDETGKKPTIERLAVYMGCWKECLKDYEEIPEFSRSIQKAKQRCLDWLISAGLDAKNPAMHIFLAKNNYGYKDKQEIDTNLNVNMADMLKASRARTDAIE